jgi:hypothetical protein
LAVIVLVTIGLIGRDARAAGVGFYVVALFLLCASPLLAAHGIRGKFSLLFVFLAFYFVTFGLGDLTRLLMGLPLGERAGRSLLAPGELVILAGAALFVLGYAATAQAVGSRARRILTRDWSSTAALVVGLACWCAGAYYNGVLQFGAEDKYVDGGADLGAFGGFYSLFRVLGPLGTLMLIYAYLTQRRGFVLVLLLITLVADFGLGFLGDRKEIAFRGPLLFACAYALLRERVPVIPIVLVAVLAGLTFDYFAAYRTYLGTRAVSRTEGAERAIEDFGATVGSDRGIGERFAAGIEYAANRISLKQNVLLIVDRTGKDVEFQDGYTLAPLLFAFVPRFILPNKQDASEAGLLFNDEFGIASEGVFISVSHLGDLYWNFGWPGVVTGMLAIGALMGLVGALCRLDRSASLPKFLLLMLTVYLLVFRFETSIALGYTYWARAVVLLLLIHLLAPKGGRHGPATRP